MRNNIVLIGMPCCGKSTIGRMLAEKTNRPFFDLDESIVKAAGMTIPEIFRRFGENSFREMESEQVRNVSSINDGRIISTGGGTVTRPGNVSALKKTGLLVFLDRPLEELKPASDRPLADNIEKIRSLYNERYPVYFGVADIRVDSRGTPETVLNTVLDLLEKTGERIR